MTPPHDPELTTLQSDPCSDDVGPPHPACTRLGSDVETSRADMEEHVTGCPSRTFSQRGNTPWRDAVRLTPPFTLSMNQVPSSRPWTTFCTAPGDTNFGPGPNLGTNVVGPANSQPNEAPSKCLEKSLNKSPCCVGVEVVLWVSNPANWLSLLSSLLLLLFLKYSVFSILSSSPSAHAE